MKPAETLNQVSQYLLQNDLSRAIEVLNDCYPFESPVKPENVAKNLSNKNNAVPEPAQRNYSQKDALLLFSEDGYIDRYSGEKLVCPSALYAISAAIPEAFPYLGKRLNSHQAFWDLFPSLDHIAPVSTGGLDERSNWVTTSMSTNMKKSNVSLNDLGWKIHPAGSMEEWDGLVGW